MSMVIGASMMIERRRVAVVERRRVDEGLERRARLAHRLRRAVELALVEGEAADHGVDAAGMRVHHDHGAGDLGHLAQPVLAGLAVERLDIDDVAGAEHLVDVAAGPADAVGRDRCRCSRSRAIWPDGFARRLQADARLPGRRPRARPQAARAARRRAPAPRRAPGPIRVRRARASAARRASRAPRRSGRGRRRAPCGPSPASSDRGWCGPRGRPRRASSRRSARRSRAGPPRRRSRRRWCSGRSTRGLTPSGSFFALSASSRLT